MRTWSLAAAAILAACSDGKAPEATQDAGGSSCQWDNQNDPSTAVALAAGKLATGYLCPIEDVDWFSFDTGAGNGLLTLSLKMDTPLSTVEPTYTVYSKTSAAAAGPVVVPPPPVKTGESLGNTYCVTPGAYFITVSDYGSDGEDQRHQYSLVATAAQDKDENEPNDDAQTATEIPEAGGAFTGYVSCKGDQDWFSLTVAGRRLLNVGLTAGASKVLFTADVVDDKGATLATLTHEGGPTAPTDVHRRVAAPAAGVYSIVVTSGGGAAADPEVPYQLTVGVEEDADKNEPNDTSAAATPLGGGTVTCNDEWSPWIEMTGTIGFAGDLDWFRLPLAGCVRGLIEASVTFDTSALDAATQWEFQSRVQAEISVIRSHDTSPCTADSECRLLTRKCHTSWDCSGLFSTCQKEGFCAGATVCLPEKTCGATLIEDHYQVAQIPSPVTGPPPPDTAIVSAPFYDLALLYLKVSDFQGDGEGPSVPYTLRVRVRNDPDQNEPNNPFYAPDLLQSTDIAPQQVKAVPIPVHDCVAGDCCDASTWIAGAISYRNDVDWFKYEHPCPGSDCMLRIAYELDAGPVDFLISVYHQDTLWDDGIVPGVTELPSQPAQSGAYGGPAAADKCYYAFRGHKAPKECQAGERCVAGECLTPTGACAVDADCTTAGNVCISGECVDSPIACDKDDDCAQQAQAKVCYLKRCIVSSGGCTPFLYYVSIRDFADVRDWDSDQSYRFCVEKIADGCHGDLVCQEKQCVAALFSCSGAGDCPAGETCSGNVCVTSSGVCAATGDCTNAGDACINNQCVASQGTCSTTKDCAAAGPCMIYNNGCGPRL